MLKKEMSELRKAFKKDMVHIDRVFHMYVSNENEVLWEDQEGFVAIPEDQQNRMLEMVQEVLNPAIGKKTHCVPVSQNDTLLNILQRPDHVDKEWKAIQDALLSAYIHTDPYYMMVIEFDYDVPGAYTDGTRAEDASEEVFSALLCAVCPAKLSAAELGYVDKIKELDRRWVVKKPSVGFLYPSFNERSTDLNEAVFYTKTPKIESSLHILFDVQEMDIPDSDEEYRDKFASLVAGMEIDMESAALVQETILEKAEQNPDEVLHKDEVRRMFEQYSDADMTTYDNVYDNVMREDIPVSSVAQQTLKIVTDSCEIKCSMDRAEMIREEVIDGVTYICVPADGDVSVGGALTIRKNRGAK